MKNKNNGKDKHPFEKLVLEYLRSLIGDKNAKLHELTDYVLRETDTSPRMKQVDAYNVIGHLLIRLKKDKVVKYIGGKGCGWRLNK